MFLETKFVDYLVSGHAYFNQISNQSTHSAALEQKKNRKSYNEEERLRTNM